MNVASPVVTPDELDRWYRAATRARLAIYLKAVHPCQADREEAFADMGRALADAIEKVRVASAALREMSRQLVGREEMMGETKHHEAILSSD